MFQHIAKLGLFWPQIPSFPSYCFVCNAGQSPARSNCQAPVQGCPLRGPGRKMESKKKGGNRVFFSLSLSRALSLGAPILLWGLHCFQAVCGSSFYQPIPVSASIPSSLCPSILGLYRVFYFFFFEKKITCLFFKNLSTIQLMQTLYITGVQYSHSQLLKSCFIYSYYKILPIFPVLYNISSQHILYSIACTSYSSIPILSLPPSLPPLVMLFSISMSLPHLCFTHQFAVLFRFHIQVILHSICLSLSDLLYLA